MLVAFSIFVLFIFVALINHVYNKKHKPLEVKVNQKPQQEHFCNDIFAVSFESLMPLEKKYYEYQINPVLVRITPEERVSNTHIAIKIAAKKALDEISKNYGMDNPYVKLLLELKDKDQYFRSHTNKHRGLKAKIKYLYDDAETSPEWEMLYSKNNVDFLHKDWWSI